LLGQRGLSLLVSPFGADARSLHQLFGTIHPMLGKIYLMVSIVKNKNWVPFHIFHFAVINIFLLKIKLSWLGLERFFPRNYFSLPLKGARKLV
jgi:hypothetical protein